MLVYRVEKNGRGPYTDSGMERMSNAHNASAEHPLSWWDCGTQNGFVCGFVSIGTFKSWFGEFISDLIDADFKLSTYEVDCKYIKFGESTKQLVFDKTHAHLMESVSIKRMI